MSDPVAPLPNGGMDTTPLQIDHPASPDTSGYPSHPKELPAEFQIGVLRMVNECQNFGFVSLSAEASRQVTDCERLQAGRSGVFLHRSRLRTPGQLVFGAWVRFRLARSQRPGHEGKLMAIDAEVLPEVNYDGRIERLRDFYGTRCVDASCYRLDGFTAREAKSMLDSGRMTPRHFYGYMSDNGLRCAARYFGASVDWSGDRTAVVEAILAAKATSDRPPVLGQTESTGPDGFDGESCDAMTQDVAGIIAAVGRGVPDPARLRSRFGCKPLALVSFDSRALSYARVVLATKSPRGWHWAINASCIEAPEGSPEVLTKGVRDAVSEWRGARPEAPVLLDISHATPQEGSVLTQVAQQLGLTLVNRSSARADDR